MVADISKQSLSKNKHNKRMKLLNLESIKDREDNVDKSPDTLWAVRSGLER